VLGSIAPAVIYGENRDRCGVQTPVNQPSTNLFSVSSM